jgi:tRNA(Leu) C34 or U34 (ribose-2'-O)-methylase TrmL
VLVFGSESSGLPPALLEAHEEGRVYIPVERSVRSLNLANVVCLAAYTALHRAGLPMPANDGAHEPHPDAGSVPPIERVQG